MRVRFPAFQWLIPSSIRGQFRITSRPVQWLAISGTVEKPTSATVRHIRVCTVRCSFVPPLLENHFNGKKLHHCTYGF